MLIQKQLPFSDSGMNALKGLMPGSASELADRAIVVNPEVFDKKSVVSYLRSYFDVNHNDDLWTISNVEKTHFTPGTSVKLAEFGAERTAEIIRTDSKDGEQVELKVVLENGHTPLRIVLVSEGEYYVLADKGKYILKVPSDSILGLAVLLPAVFLGIESSIQNRSMLSNNTGATTEFYPGECDRGSNNGAFKFSHNLLCNLPGAAKNLVTTDGRFYLTISCFIVSSQTIEVNCLDCCKQHDINLWCSENNLEALSADEAVVACFTAKIYDQGMAKIDPLCGILSLGYLQFSAEVAVGYFLATLAGLFFNLGTEEQLIGWGGRNKESCLCGGKEPTAFCREPCRDACREAGRKSSCEVCSTKCNYDIETGKAKSFRHVPNASGAPCCPGSQVECMPQWWELQKKCPDQEKLCFDCYYVCDACYKYDPKFCPNPGVKTIRKIAAEDKPCCKGTPKPFAPDFCSNTDLRKDETMK